MGYFWLFGLFKSSFSKESKWPRKQIQSKYSKYWNKWEKGIRSYQLLTFSSYGSVWKARHKKSNRIVAVKIIPADTDLNDLMKEITILKECRSDFIIRYYGSYYKDGDLWVSVVFFFSNAIDCDGIWRLWISCRCDE